jgi:hypothetical protein
MKLRYKANDNNLLFPLGKVESRVNKPDIKLLHLGTFAIQDGSFAQLSEAQVLAILGEVVHLTSAKIKVEFEEGVVLEFE